MLAVIAPLIAALAAPADTIFTLGSREIDMTGDGQPEVLSLVAQGPSTDSLGVTFQIVSSGRVLYAASLHPITRVEGDDAARRTRTPAEQLAFVGGFGARFFADDRFVPASRFLADLTDGATGRARAIPSVIARHRAAYRDHALGGLESVPPSTDTTGAGAVWADMLRRDRLVFRFGPGGELATAIAWSDRDRRFYRLLSCC